jgi:hypothetical protein
MFQPSDRHLTMHSVTKNVNFDCVIGSSIPYNDEKLSKKAPIKYIYREHKREFINAHLSITEEDWKIALHTAIVTPT